MNQGFDLLWVHGFRFCFTPLTGVLFAVPSRYYALSVAVSYLALDRGRPSFRQGFSGLAVLRTPSHGAWSISPTGLSPSVAGLPMPFDYRSGFVTPRALAYRSGRYLQHPAYNGMHLGIRMGLGSSPFARRYLGNLD